MEPIATYSEKRFSGTRKYELFKDSIHIQGSICTRGDFDTTLSLKDLHPEYSVMRFREKGWASGLWLIIIPLFIAGVLSRVYKLTFDNFLFDLTLIIPVAGIVMMLAMSKKVTYYSFKNSSGIAVLDIARSGKEKEMFEGFVEKLTVCIKDSHPS